jgi:hypothetical protein
MRAAAKMKKLLKAKVQEMKKTETLSAEQVLRIYVEPMVAVISKMKKEVKGKRPV